MAITAAQVKELREKTGAGMMDAKKALVETDGDMEKAVDVLREKGVAKAAKKSDRIAAEGLAEVLVDGNKAILVEMNSETDFVATNDKFTTLMDQVATAILANEPADLEAALALPLGDSTVADEITNLTAVIGEKISLRRFEIVKKGDDDHFGSYKHNGGAIVALVTLHGADDDTARDVAMHVAAINPKYTTREDVPADVLAHETEVVTEETKNEGKPENIIPRIVEGRISKFLSEISLVDQEFVKDPDLTVGKYVSQKNGTVASFVRFEVGEGIEKKEDNFAEEVMSQIKN